MVETSTLIISPSFIDEVAQQVESRHEDMVVPAAADQPCRDDDGRNPPYMSRLFDTEVKIAYSASMDEYPEVCLLDIGR